MQPGSFALLVVVLTSLLFYLLSLLSMCNYNHLFRLVCHTQYTLEASQFPQISCLIKMFIQLFPTTANEACCGQQQSDAAKCTADICEDRLCNGQPITISRKQKCTAVCQSLLQLCWAIPGQSASRKENDTHGHVQVLQDVHMMTTQFSLQLWNMINIQFVYNSSKS